MQIVTNNEKYADTFEEKNIHLCKYSVAVSIYFDKCEHSFSQPLNFRSDGYQ